MPITAEQRAERKHHIGSSDMAAILGLDPFRTAYDVWLQKKGRLIDDSPEEPDGRDPRYAGNRLEGGVLDFAEDRLGPLIRNCPRKVEGTPLMVNTDALVAATSDPVEVKTVGLFGRLRDDEWWGEDGTQNQVPDRVIVQAHAHMLAWDRDVCHVPALIGGRGFVLLSVTLDHRIIDVICRRAADFWQKNVLADVPPSDSHASLEIVKLVRREPKKVVAVDPELVRAWLEAKAASKAADEDKEKAEAAMITALGDAEAGLCGELGAITYYEQQRKEYVSKATAFRVPRHRPKGL